MKGIYIYLTKTFKFEAIFVSNFQVKSNLADGINQLGDELEDIKEYKPSDSSNNPNGDIWYK